MPKMKTSRGAKKRFKFTATGKIKHKRANTRHILTGKAKGRKRHLKGTAVVDVTNAPALKRLMPYG